MDRKPDFLLRVIMVIISLWLVIAFTPEMFAPKNYAHASDSEEETLYASHPCESGSWYSVGSDKDSVTVACAIDPDPPDPEK